MEKFQGGLSLSTLCRLEKLYIEGMRVFLHVSVLTRFLCVFSFQCTKKERSRV
jgi:hypothetical protein